MKKGVDTKCESPTTSKNIKINIYKRKKIWQNSKKLKKDSKLYHRTTNNN